MTRRPYTRGPCPHCQQQVRLTHRRHTLENHYHRTPHGNYQRCPGSGLDPARMAAALTTIPNLVTSALQR